MRWCTSRRKWSGEEFRLPLLIGGATTSRAHTAVKIAQHYRESAVHVLDASRAVGVVSALLNPDAKEKFDVNTRMDYERLRGEHANRTREKKMLTLAQARENRLRSIGPNTCHRYRSSWEPRTFLRRPERSRGIPWSNRKYCAALRSG